MTNEVGGAENQRSQRVVEIYFEDFHCGRFGSFGPRHVTREEIIAFASEFDPQPMHVDEEAAKRTMMNGLSASGWHLCGLMMRMLVDGFIGRSSSLGAPGVDTVRWLAPLRPGDDITLDVDILDTRLSASRPGIGIVKVKSTIRNGRDQVLCEMVSSGFFKQRGKEIS